MEIKKVKKFIREASLDELKKSLIILINNNEIDTREKFIFLLKDFVRSFEINEEFKKEIGFNEEAKK